VLVSKYFPTEVQVKQLGYIVFFSSKREVVVVSALEVVVVSVLATFVAGKSGNKGEL
jgi:hypothetical protein